LAPKSSTVLILAAGIEAIEAGTLKTSSAQQRIDFINNLLCRRALKLFKGNGEMAEIKGNFWKTVDAPMVST